MTPDSPTLGDSDSLEPVVIKVPANSVLCTSAYELHWNWDDRGWVKVPSDDSAEAAA